MREREENLLRGLLRGFPIWNLHFQRFFASLPHPSRHHGKANPDELVLPQRHLGLHRDQLMLAHFLKSRKW